MNKEEITNLLKEHLQHYYWGYYKEPFDSSKENKNSDTKEFLEYAFFTLNRATPMTNKIKEYLDEIFLKPEAISKRDALMSMSYLDNIQCKKIAGSKYEIIIGKIIDAAVVSDELVSYIPGILTKILTKNLITDKILDIIFEKIASQEVFWTYYNLSKCSVMTSYMAEKLVDGKNNEKSYFVNIVIRNINNKHLLKVLDIDMIGNALYYHPTSVPALSKTTWKYFLKYLKNKKKTDRKIFRYILTNVLDNNFVNFNTPYQYFKMLADFNITTFVNYSYKSFLSGNTLYYILTAKNDYILKIFLRHNEKDKINSAKTRMYGMIKYIADAPDTRNLKDKADYLKSIYVNNYIFTNNSIEIKSPYLLQNSLIYLYYKLGDFDSLNSLRIYKEDIPSIIKFLCSYIGNDVIISKKLIKSLNNKITDDEYNKIISDLIESKDCDGLFRLEDRVRLNIKSEKITERNIIEAGDLDTIMEYFESLPEYGRDKFKIKMNDYIAHYSHLIGVPEDIILYLQLKG